MKIRFQIPYPKTKAGKRQWAKEYGMNAYYAGKHWSRRKTDALYWHSMVTAEINRQGIKPRLATGPARVTFWWNDRLDIDNHAVMGKMITDALKGVILTDDSRRYLVGVSHFFHDGDSIVVEVEY